MQDRSMEVMWSSGHLSGSNAEYVEELYDGFLADPQSIPQEWRDFFESLPTANGRESVEVSH
jgi:2-oxoglutarate dehydrogenase E1 component